MVIPYPMPEMALVAHSTLRGMTALPLEQQVCSLDFAKRLKELGVKQESLFYWRGTQGRGNDALVVNRINRHDEFFDYFSAFTVAELLAELRKHCFGVELKTNDIEGWGALVLPKVGDWTREYDANPANALAKVLILVTV